jgi:hypothetical protein
MNIELELTMREVFAALSEGDRCHMTNLLYKEGYRAAKQIKAAEVLAREWVILDEACDFWKQEAIDRGYEE